MAENVMSMSLLTYAVSCDHHLMQIALVLYPRFTTLDIIGPFQVLADVPGHDIVWVAETAGPVIDHTGRTPLTATKTFDEVLTPDVVVVPGGMANDANPALTAWLSKVHPTTQWTTTVCTGSVHLARTGLLTGLEATTHWAWAKGLNELGAIYTEKRVVEQGKIITAAGVSSGIDMALTLVSKLHNDTMAQMVQLAIEYDPQPPFDAGSPSKAPADVLSLMKTFYS